ncbi:hypothetical protein WN943_006303 [Citrus x changshan-huyou]
MKQRSFRHLEIAELVWLEEVAVGMAISGSGSGFSHSGSGPGHQILITGPVLNPVFFDPGPVRVQPGKIQFFGFRVAALMIRDEEDERCGWFEPVKKNASGSGYFVNSVWVKLGPDHPGSSGSGRESELIKDIVKEISKRLNPTFPSDVDGLVGIASRMEKMNGYLEAGLDDVRFIGICGMGGIGKTMQYAKRSI